MDTASGAVETLATGATPTDVAAGAEAVWVANGRPLKQAQFVGPATTEIVQFDAATRTRRAQVALPRDQGAVSNRLENGLAVASRAVWAVTASGSVVRIDPRTATITARTRKLGAIAVAAGGAGIWALLDDATVVALDERSARVRRRVRLPTAAPTAIGVGATAAWATSSVDGTLWRIGRDGAVGSVEVGSGVTDVVAGDAGIWVANPIDGTVTAIDPASMRVVRSRRAGGHTALARDRGRHALGGARGESARPPARASPASRRSRPRCASRSAPARRVVRTCSSSPTCRSRAA